MDYHDDPDDMEFRNAMELQMRKIPEEQLRCLMRRRAMTATQNC